MESDQQTMDKNGGFCRATGWLHPQTSGFEAAKNTGDTPRNAPWKPQMLVMFPLQLDNPLTYPDSVLWIYVFFGPLIDWLIACLIAWLIAWLLSWLVGWLVALIGCLLDCLLDWLVDWLVGWLIAYLIGWLVGWLLTCLVGWLIGWLLDCLLDWLVDWLTEGISY